MPPTVMVVDDDGDILDMTRLVLEGGGYHVLPA
ncbi:MAG: DNA-binding response regulator, partial [Acidobacteria bacterium]